METTKKKATTAGGKPTKEVCVSYHPELRGIGVHGMARGPQGRFPDGWRAKQPGQEARLANGGVGQHKENSHRKDERSHVKGAYKHRGGPQAFPPHDACIARHVADGDREYGNACCGKCKHHLRVWGVRVWACDNAMSEKHGFPTDYGNTCTFFERENLDRR